MIMKDQQSMPLYYALKKHAQIHPTSFHVPGHKYGHVFPENTKNDFASILHLDATELTNLDDLHEPSGVIKKAQSLAAELYRVKNSYFLVGGSTSGNLAMILASCKKGDTVFVQRNCHKSIIHALRLAGVKPVFLLPEYDERHHLPVGLSVKKLEKALESFSDVKALILTSPNYFGMSVTKSEFKKVIQLAHSKQIPVLVDEAHGAHFILGDPFPTSSTRLGADLVVHSAHKTLPAMTMGSYLHFNSNLVCKEKLEYYLQVVQTSSPSYPIMASLDIARYFLAQLEKEKVDELFLHIQDFRKQLQQIEQIEVLPLQSSNYIGDPLKLTIQTNTDLSGFDLQKRLENKKIFVEMADPYHVLFVLPLIPLKNTEELTAQIADVVKDQPVRKNRKTFHLKEIEQVPISVLDLSFEQMENSQVKEIALQDAVGSISASTIIPYPPGVPLLMAGEKVRPSHIETILFLKDHGANFQGDWDEKKNRINIFI